MENKKKIILGSIIGVFIGLLLGTTYAIFSYTRTGGNNQLIAGDIYMHYNETNTLTIENALPSSTYDPTKYFEFTIKGKNTNTKYNIVYDINLNYGDNIDNKIRIQDRFLKFRLVEVVNNEEQELLNDKSYLSINNKRIYVSTIPKETNTEITKTYRLYMWIDKSVVIGNTDYSDYSMTDWNNVYGSVKVSVTGDFSEKSIQTEPYLVMKNLNGIQAWKNIRANITSIEFHADGIAPESPVTTIDVTDTTSAGDVTLYTLDDGLGNGTYKAIVVADDIIYAPENSSVLFGLMSKLRDFNSINFRVDNTLNMTSMFVNCSSLVNTDGLISWNTSNVTSMVAMFMGCTKLLNLRGLINWDVSRVSTMDRFLYNCSALQNVNELIKWKTASLTSTVSMFYGCSHLQNLNGLINWNITNLENIQSMFYGCSELSNIDGLTNWNTSNVTNMSAMFHGCANLSDTNGLVNWNTVNVKSMDFMFNDCTELTSLNLSSWNMSKVTNNKSMFQSAGFISLIMPNNYKRIDNFMFNHNYSYTGSSFTIPKSVTYIGNSHIFYDFGQDDTFNRFIVESGSTSFKTIDDILYTYDGTRLISVPRGKTFTNNTYEMPEGVTFMNELSFSRNRNIDTLILPNSYVIERIIVKNNNSYGFSNSGNSLSVAVYEYTSVKRYEVKNDNTRYMSYEGCIYSKDGSELIAVPLHYNGVLNIKSGTTSIGQEAIWTDSDVISKFDNITQINIPASVTTIEANQLSTLNSLMSRSTNPVTITIDSGNTAYKILNNQIVTK